MKNNIASMVLSSDDLEATADEIVKSLVDQSRGEIESAAMIVVATSAEDSKKLTEFAEIFADKMTKAKERIEGMKAEAERPDSLNDYVAMNDLSRIERQRLVTLLTVGEILNHGKESAKVLITSDLRKKLNKSKDDAEKAAA